MYCHYYWLLSTYRFANNETNVVVNEVVRGQNVYIIQTAGAGKPHDHLMEVLFMVNACR